MNGPIGCIYTLLYLTLIGIWIYFMISLLLAMSIAASVAVFWVGLIIIVILGVPYLY